MVVVVVGEGGGITMIQMSQKGLGISWNTSKRAKGQRKRMAPLGGKKAGDKEITSKVVR